MKKLSIILLLACFAPIAVFAQLGGKGNSNVVAIGVKGGLSFPQMYYSDSHLNELPQPWLKDANGAFRILPIGGVFVDIPLGNFVSIAPEAMFAQRGTSMSYQHYSGSKVDYSISSRYVDLRIPVVARLNVVDAFQPYVVAGLEAGYLLGGQITEKRTAPYSIDTTINIGKANMATIHAGAFAGVGIRSDINCGAFTLMLKLDATYHHGFVDSYSSMEHEDASNPVNINAYNINGVRLPRGLEVCFSLGVPLKFNKVDDACSTFSNSKYRPKHHKGTMYGF